MKQSDIFSIIIVATVGTLISFFLVKSILGDPDLAQADIKVINAISATIDTPDPELFNPEAINPTVEVYIGNIDDDGSTSDDDDYEMITCPDGSATVSDLSLCGMDDDEYDEIVSKCDSDYDGYVTNEEYKFCGFSI